MAVIHLKSFEDVFNTGNEALDKTKFQLVEHAGCGWSFTLTDSDPLPDSFLQCVRLLCVNQMECYLVQSTLPLQGPISPRNELETHVTIRKLLRLLLAKEESAEVQSSLRELNNRGAAFVAEKSEGRRDHSAAVKLLCKDLAEAGARGLDRVAVTNFPITGRGLAAAMNLEPLERIKTPAEDALLAIPESFLITPAAALESDQIGQVLAAIDGLDADTQLFLFIIFESTVNLEESQWHHYWTSLPTTFTTPLMMPDKTLTLIEGTALHSAVMQTKQQLRQLHAMLFPLLSDLYPTLFPLEHFTINRFFFTKSLLDSRALQVRIDNEITTCLVPLVDMLNHRPAAHCWRRWFDDESRTFCVDLNEPCLAGTQIFLSYGPLRNWELLQDYGFVDEDNPYDTFALEFEVPEGEQTRLQIMTLHGLQSDHHLMLNQAPPPNCLAFLRVLVADAAELARLSVVDPRTGPLSDSNEHQALQMLQGSVEVLRKRLGATPSSNTTDSNAQLLLSFRSSQVAILDSVLSWIAQEISKYTANTPSSSTAHSKKASSSKKKTRK